MLLATVRNNYACFQAMTSANSAFRIIGGLGVVAEFVLDCGQRVGQVAGLSGMHDTRTVRVVVRVRGDGKGGLVRDTISVHPSFPAIPLTIIR